MKTRDYRAEYRARKSRENHAIFTSHIQKKITLEKDPLHHTGRGLEPNGNTIAILCANKHTKKPVKRVTKKQKYTTLFQDYLNSLKHIAELQHKDVHSFTFHLTSKATMGIRASGKESFTTTLHNRISKAIKYHTNTSNPLFFFALSYDAPTSANAQTRNAQEYTGVHIHGFIALNPNEENSRKTEGQNLREAFRSINAKAIKTNSLKKQEFKIPTKSERERYETAYTPQMNAFNQCRYMAKNALQFERYNVGNNIIQSRQKPYSASKAITGLLRNKPTASQNNTNPSKDIPTTTNAPQTPLTSKLPPHIEKLRADLLNNPEIGVYSQQKIIDQRTAATTTPS